MANDLKVAIRLLLTDTQNFQQQVSAALNRAVYNAGRSMGPQYGAGLAASGLSQKMALSGLYAPGGAMGDPWKYIGPVPPVIRGGGGRGNVNWASAALGMTAGMFSPWIGGATLAKSGIFETGIGKSISDIFGGGKIGNFAASYTAIQLSTRALKTAFDELREAIQKTAKLYQQSLAINRPITSLYQAKSAFAAIGLSEDAAKRYAKSGPAGLNAEEMMQLTNLSASFRRNWNDAAVDAQAMAYAAKDTQGNVESILRLKREWSAFWTGGTKLLSPFLDQYSSALQGATMIANKINGLFGGTNAGGSPLAGGEGFFNWNKFRVTSMERMGFTIGGNGPNALIRETNAILRQILTAIGKGAGAAMPPIPLNAP